MIRGAVPIRLGSALAPVSFGAVADRKRTRLDPDDRREQILDAATRVFRDHEFSSVSLEQVAAAASVTRGLLHHYFGSKRDLYLAVVERTARIPDDMPLAPDGVEGDLPVVLRASVDSWMRMIESAGGLWPGGAGGALGDADLDGVLRAARDDLVERMVVEVPFPPDLDPELLRSALRAYAAFARAVTDEWITERSLDREHATLLLHGTLLALVEQVVPRKGV